MILDPDFLHHWKLKALSSTIGQAPAIIAVLSLWSHCQNRKEWCFPLTSRMLAGICEYLGDHEVLLQEMVECGFLDVCGDGIFEVHGWAEKNAQLIHNWNAGKKGGRPQKAEEKPQENPRVNPRPNPGVNPGKTLGVTDKIREDKIREEERGNTPSGLISLELSSDPEPVKKQKGRAGSMDEVVRYATLQGCKGGEGEDFWDKMEAGGWKRNNQKVADWQAHFRTFLRNGWLNSDRKPAVRVQEQGSGDSGRDFTPEDNIRAAGGTEEDIQRRRNLLAKFEMTAS